jgi:hypothetical protein
MIGRKVPLANARAIAYMIYNEARGKRRRRLKRQARREDRRYQKAVIELYKGAI